MPYRSTPNWLSRLLNLILVDGILLAQQTVFSQSVQQEIRQHSGVLRTEIDSSMNLGVLLTELQEKLVRIMAYLEEVSVSCSLTGPLLFFLGHPFPSRDRMCTWSMLPRNYPGPNFDSADFVSI